MPGKLRFVVLICLIFGLAGCAPAVTQAPAETAAPALEAAPTATFETVHIKLGVLNFMSHSPLHIAAQNGYFAAQGLDVELVDFGNSDRDMLPALLAGQLDAGAMILSTSTFHAIEQGGNLKYVADKGFINPANTCATDAWVARTELLENGAFDSADGMRGLQMTNSVGNTLEYANDLMLADIGLTADDMTIVDMRDQVARLDALGNGSLDFYGVSEPWITRAINTGNAGVWRSFTDYVPNLTVGGIVFGPSLLEQDPEVGARFMVAYLNAVEQYNQGKTEQNLEVISGFTQLDPEEIKGVCWTSFQPDGKINSTTMLEFAAWGLAKGYLDGPVTLEQLWDPQYVDRANAILGK